jgi:hypothetical protein
VSWFTSGVFKYYWSNLFTGVSLFGSGVKFESCMVDGYETETRDMVLEDGYSVGFYFLVGLSLSGVVFPFDDGLTGFFTFITVLFETEIFLLFYLGY